MRHKPYPKSVNVDGHVHVIFKVLRHHELSSRMPSSVSNVSQTECDELKVCPTCLTKFFFFLTILKVKW